MSSIALVTNNFSCDKEVYPDHDAKSDINSFTGLPKEIQYTILELIGGIDTQISILDKFPELQNTVIKRKVMKAYRFFSREAEESPAKIAYNAAVKKINSDKNVESVFFETITNLAFKNLFKMLNEPARNTVEDDFGLYSLNVEKIKKTQQLILDQSLLTMWNKIKRILEVLHITNLPANNAETIRKWLEENNAILQQIDFLYLEDLKVIPPEISYLTGISSLSICKGKISDLTPIANLRNLQELKLSNNEISDIRALKDLTRLESLTISRNKISNITPLKDLISLKNLWMHYNQISDINALKNLVNLENLYACRNQISDITPLKNLINLKKIWMFENQISDVTTIENLKNIQELELQVNQIKDVSALKNLVNIKKLNIWANPIIDTSIFIELENLIRSKNGEHPTIAYN